MKQWEAIENILPQRNNQRDKSKLAHQIKMITIIVMTLSLGKL